MLMPKKKETQKEKTLKQQICAFFLN